MIFPRRQLQACAHSLAIEADGAAIFVIFQGVNAGGDRLIV